MLASMKPNVMGAPGKPRKGQGAMGHTPTTFTPKCPLRTDVSTKDKTATCPVCPAAEHARWCPVSSETLLPKDPLRKVRSL